MIFAAGVGSRLKELTKNTPKCLMQAGGKTLLEHAVERLKAAGVRAVMINVHHHAEQVQDFVRAQKKFGLQVSFSEESVLLDTGGGLKKAKEFFEGQTAFLVHNADVYSNCDLSALVAAHKAKRGVATLAVMQRYSSRGLFFNANMQLRGWTEEVPPYSPAKGSDQLLAFSGISVASSELFQYMDDSDAFSIVRPFLKAAKTTERVWGHSIDGSEWVDIGTPEHLKALQDRLNQSP